MTGEANGHRHVRWYEIVYVLVLLVLLVLSVYFMNPHRVGIININGVAKEVGVDVRIAADARQQQQDAIARGTRLQQAYEVRMEDLNGKLKAATAKADKDRLQADLKSEQERFEKNLTAIRGEMQKRENLIFASFQKRLEPFVKKTAVSRRLDVVLDSGAGIVYSRSTVDITADVVDQCRSLFTPTLSLIDGDLAVKAVPAEEQKAPKQP